MVSHFGAGWLGFEGLPDEVAGVARTAIQAGYGVAEAGTVPGPWPPSGDTERQLATAPPAGRRRNPAHPASGPASQRARTRWLDRKEAPMSSSQHFSVGTIGAGTLAQAIAGHAVAAGHHVIFSNSRGPESLEPLASRFGANASAGTVAEAARADIVILAVGWEQVPAAVKDVPDWNGRIVIDATNQWQDFSRGIAADLGDQTGSERNAALMPGARVVKAFNALYGRITAQNPRRTDGRLVAFLAGDDADAKATVSAFADSMGFAPVDLGGLHDAGRLMQVGGGPLSGLHVVKLE